MATEKISIHNKWLIRRENLRLNPNCILLDNENPRFGLNWEPIENQDKITGLTLGADDYITKPFNSLELVARVKSAIRRYKQYNNYKTDEEKIYIDGLEICKEQHKCLLYDKEIDLTPIEFDILLYLASKKGEVVSSEELFEKVWKEKYLDNNNTVMVHIRRIREKLKEDTKNPKYIKTVWGVGYKIEWLQRNN